MPVGLPTDIYPYQVPPADQIHFNTDHTSFSMGEMARKYRAAQDQE